MLARRWPQKRTAHEFGVCERTFRKVIAGNYRPRIDAPPQINNKRPGSLPRKWTQEKNTELLNGRASKRKSLRQRLSDARKALSEKYPN